MRLSTGDEQLKAKDAIQKALIPDPADPPYVVALNLLSRSPSWLSAVGAAPMYLGLDLRGGVHFMLQVDMQAALTTQGRVPVRRPAHRTAREERAPFAASAATTRRSRCSLRDAPDAGGGQGA